jgi:hypothetical protein
MEFGKTQTGQSIYGYTASVWNSFTLLPCIGISMSYYKDNSNARSFSIRPMVGWSLAAGIQTVYGYDFHVIQPNYDFGNNSRFSIRINAGLLNFGRRVKTK